MFEEDGAERCWSTAAPGKPHNKQCVTSSVGGREEGSACFDDAVGSVAPPAGQHGVKE